MPPPGTRSARGGSITFARPTASVGDRLRHEVDAPGRNRCPNVSVEAMRGSDQYSHLTARRRTPELSARSSPARELDGETTTVLDPIVGPAPAQ